MLVCDLINNCIVENFLTWQGEAVEFWFSLISVIMCCGMYFQSKLSDGFLKADNFLVNQQSFALRAEVLCKHQIYASNFFFFSNLCTLSFPQTMR